MSQQQPQTQPANNSLLALPNFPGDDEAEASTEPGRPRWRRRGVLIALSIVVLVVLIGGLLLSRVSRRPRVSYLYQQVTLGTVSRTVTATGPLLSPATYNLVAKSTGATIAEIDVSVGQSVSKGQVLARLDKTALQDAVNQAQATVNADQDALNNAVNTSGQNSAPAIQAQDTLKIAQAQLATARDNLNNATLTAPHSGVVTAINGTVGGTPGMATNTGATTAGNGTFIQIVDLSSMQVQASVNEADIANLQVGDPVSFTVQAYGERPFHGSVAAISPFGVLTSNVVVYPVTIKVDMASAQGAQLFPNMTANVTITTAQHQDVLLIPVDAINIARLASRGTSTTAAPQLVSSQDAAAAQNIAQQWLNDLEQQNPDLAGQSPTAGFVLEQAQGRFVARPVVLGLTDGQVYEVLKGLSYGERVLVATASGSTPGATAGNGG